MQQQPIRDPGKVDWLGHVVGSPQGRDAVSAIVSRIIRSSGALKTLKLDQSGVDHADGRFTLLTQNPNPIGLAGIDAVPHSSSSEWLIKLGQRPVFENDVGEEGGLSRLLLIAAVQRANRRTVEDAPGRPGPSIMNGCAWVEPMSSSGQPEMFQVCSISPAIVSSTRPSSRYQWLQGSARLW